jgi:hypothetical protein
MEVVVNNARLDRFFTFSRKDLDFDVSRPLSPKPEIDTIDAAGE